MLKEEMVRLVQDAYYFEGKFLKYVHKNLKEIKELSDEFHYQHVSN